MSTLTEPQTRSGAFIHYLFEHCQHDKGFAARLRRASNPATEYQSWEILGRFGINLENDAERRVYGLVSAALANSRAQTNGSLKLGQAIALSFPDGSNSDQAKARLRRLLACESVEEVCRILRPLLSLIQSRVSQPLDYENLLNDLLFFNRGGERVRARWAQQFYASEPKGEGGK